VRLSKAGTPISFSPSKVSGQAANFVDAIANAQTDQAVKQEVATKSEDARYHLGSDGFGIDQTKDRGWPKEQNHRG
jgi:hypothetical protein